MSAENLGMRRLQGVFVVALGLLCLLVLLAGLDFLYHLDHVHLPGGAAEAAGSSDPWRQLLTSPLVYGLIVAAFGLLWLRLAMLHKRLSQEHQSRARAAELLKSLVIIANEASDAGQAIETCLRLICSSSGWPVGHAYRLSEGGSRSLVPTAHWHFDEPNRYKSFHDATMATRFESGVGMPGRVLASGLPEWIADIRSAAGFTRAPLAADHGLKSAMCFPILVGKDVAGVLEFFSAETVQPEQATLDILSQAGAQLGRVIERQRAAKERRESESALQRRVMELEDTRHRLEQQGADLVRITADLKAARDSAEAANEAKSEFLANMSHELRTPLNAILGFSEVIRDQAFGPVGSVKYREYARDIHESGQHLLDLINDILDLSKIESGTSELFEDMVDVPKTIASINRLVQPRSEVAEVEIRLELQEDLPFLRADVRSLKQILVNLLTNAIKFSHAGGAVTLRVSCEADNGFLFQVIDTGVGMAPEDVPRAMAKFGQIDSGLNRKYEGTGLGLPLTKALVEQHGGSFEVRSQLGEGTNVTVRFPGHRTVSETQAAGGLSRVAN